MITPRQARVIEAAAKAGIACSWESGGYNYTLIPAAAGGIGSIIATLKLRDDQDTVMVFDVRNAWTYDDSLYFSTAGDFWMVLLTAEDEEGEE